MTGCRLVGWNWIQRKQRIQATWPLFSLDPVSSQQLSQISITDIPLQSTTIRVGESALDLVVIIDSKLSLSAHVAALCRTGFYHLRQLRPVLISLTHEAARTLIQAFISRRLDYYNSLLYGVSDNLNLIRRVQSVQNTASARLLTGARRRDHISPVLRQLYWLPVQRRVDYKLACFVFSSLLATHLRTSPTRYIWSLKVPDGGVGYALPPTDRVVPFHVHTTHSATGASLLPGHMFVTVFQPTCATRTLHPAVSRVNSKRICFNVVFRTQCDLRYINKYPHLLTYLLTYLNCYKIKVNKIQITL